MDLPGRKEKILEICVDNIYSVKNALAGGADRLELCSALTEGGLTPSLGLAKITKDLCRPLNVPVFAMIRIRGGNFVYSKEEVDAMVEDVENLRDLVDGFVFGALTAELELDVEPCKRILKAAGSLPVTFHRAFDEVTDMMTTVNVIRTLGFKRILTSGLAPTAVDGIRNISRLTLPQHDPIIMPGAGITESNLKFILDETKGRILECHGSGKFDGINHSYPTLTSEERVRKMKTILANWKPSQSE